MAQKPEEKYKAGWSAFEKGDFAAAIKEAAACMQDTAADSHWYAAAMSLHCWASHFSGDFAAAERDAYTLLTLDTGDEKLWFDGLALINLGIMRRKVGDIGEAELIFDQASTKFATYLMPPDSFSECELSRELFAAFAYWAANDETRKLEELAQRLQGQSHTEGNAGHVYRSVELYLRLAKGDDVKAEATKASAEGVHRTLLAPILLG
jgi:hypothetical protein